MSALDDFLNAPTSPATQAPSVIDAFLNEGQTVPWYKYLASKAISGASNVAQGLGEAANLEAGQPQENVLQPGEMAARANQAAIGTPNPQPSNPLLKIPGAAIEGLTSAGPAAVMTAPLALATAAAGAGGEAAKQGAQAANLSPAWQTAANIGGSLAGGVAGGGAPTLSQLLIQRLKSLAPEVSAVGGASARQGVNLLGDTLAPELKYGGTTGQQIQDQISAFPDKPTMLADTAGSLQGKTEQLVSKMGPAKFIIEPALKARDQNAGARIIDDISNTISSGGSAYRTNEALTAAQKSAAGPLYQQAFEANPSIASGEIDHILATPAGQKALASAQIKMANDRVPPPSGNGYDLRTLDYVKRSLDDQIGNALQSGAKDDARILIARKNELVQEMEKADSTANVTDAQGNVTPREGGGLYAQARAAYAGPAEAKDALELGQQFRTMHPDAIADQLAGMTSGEKQHFLQGAADSLITGVNKMGAGGNEARVLLGNNHVKEQLRPLFPNDDAYDAAVSRIAEENRQFQTNTQALGNSRTAFRTSANPVPQPEGHGGIASNALVTAYGLAEHNPVAVALSGAKMAGAVGNKLRSMLGVGGQPSPDVEASMARMLTETDPVRRAAIARAVIQRATPLGRLGPGIPLSSMLGVGQSQLGPPQ